MMGEEIQREPDPDPWAFLDGIELEIPGMPLSAKVVIGLVAGVCLGACYAGLRGLV